MGLGKTIQTLSFLATLKSHGFPGPHLVVTPIAVLQNWQNEVKRFTPSLSSIKIHGSAAERDRVLYSLLPGPVARACACAQAGLGVIAEPAGELKNPPSVLTSHVSSPPLLSQLLAMPGVLRGEFDIYLTTYEMIMSEEAFFTDTFLFHTVTIDEGHRIKNESTKLGASLARISAPFRLLRTLHARPRGTGRGTGTRGGRMLTFIHCQGRRHPRSCVALQRGCTPCHTPLVVC